MKKKDGKQKRPPRIENSIMRIWSQPDKLELISCWARDGYTDKDIAEKMGISLPTFRLYRLKSPEIDNAVQNSKDIVDYKVESALLKAALGCTVEELKIIGEYVNGQLVKTIKEKTTKEQPPNVLACQTWLFNRQRDKWKRNRDNEITVEEDQSINITIKRAGKKIEVEEADE